MPGHQDRGLPVGSYPVDMFRRVVTALAGFAAVLFAYRRWLRPWHESWGATDEELSMALPGDDLVAEPAEQITRAITIDATPGEVWPWIVQLGADRGGFYSYDWLENLFGLEIHSAEEIVEEWQDLQIGDIVAASRDRSGGWVVADLRPDDALVLQVADVKTQRPIRRDQKFGWEFLWTFALRPAPSGGTRLVVRERVGFGNVAMGIVMEPVGLVSFVMTRAMLMGIKSRAEARAGLPQG